MATLVTGASGFVGSALCDALAGRGEEVIGVDLRPPRAGFAPRGRYRFVAADVSQRGALEAAFASARIDRLVVGAAITGNRARERRDAAAIIAVNVGGVAETVRCAVEAGVGRVVHLSSAAVYGDSGLVAPVLDEDEVPPKPATLYGITKLAGEATALRLADNVGMDLVAGRLGTCFGPWEHESGARDTLSAPWQVLRQMREGRAVRLPRPGQKDWLYVRDAVAGIVALLDAPRPLPRRVYNLGAGFVWSIANWCAALQRVAPSFAWSIGGDPTVDFHGDVDRAPLGHGRLVADTGFRPRFDMPDALADYLATEPLPRE